MSGEARFAGAAWIGLAMATCRAQSASAKRIRKENIVASKEDCYTGVVSLLV